MNTFSGENKKNSWGFYLFAWYSVSSGLALTTPVYFYKNHLAILISSIYTNSR